MKFGGQPKQRGFTIFEMVIRVVALFMVLFVGMMVYENYSPRPLSADELNGLKELAETSCSGGKALKAALAEKIEFSPHDLDKLRWSLQRMDEKSAAEKVRGEILGKKEKGSCD